MNLAHDFLVDTTFNRDALEGARRAEQHRMISERRAEQLASAAGVAAPVRSGAALEGGRMHRLAARLHLLGHHGARAAH
ncbi:hypothetical protein BJ978_001546 [Agromyces terreus]|uniref:Uncharacterized protein n=1 Tax=Agromyces terreus TaxID=424795 RepID=A0A9X2KC55_9MICO|nr:hypothetical protein [Agromyces terreus]MCP2370870.1 hypothetical protein [Agromyces terreus]